MEELLIKSFSKAYSECETPEDVKGVGLALRSITDNLNMTRMERGEFIHRIFSGMIELGYSKEAFPLDDYPLTEINDYVT